MDMQKPMTTTIRPVANQSAKTDLEARKKPKPQPSYHVILLDDDEHTYEYVVGMLGKVFFYPTERAFQLASEVDTIGRAIVDTTTLERAELKREQIHSFGRDWRIPKCCGSMSAILEVAVV